jgi:hypothetical protein
MHKKGQKRETPDAYALVQNGTFPNEATEIVTPLTAH